MDIRKRIRDRLQPAALEKTVADVRIGLGHTAVRLDDGRTGLALTVLQEGPRG
jgi:hypothetical protein